MIWADGPPRQHHLRFVRRLAALDIIAPQARADQIFPRILTAPAFRHDMIDRQRNACRTAILAPVAIPPEDILSRENHLLKRHPHIRGKPNHARKRHRYGSGAHLLACHTRYEFRFLKIQQNDRLFDIGNSQRLVIAIQDKDFSAELRVCRTKILILFLRVK